MSRHTTSRPTLSFSLTCVAAAAGPAGSFVTYGLVSSRSLGDGFVQTLHVRLVPPEAMVLGRTYTITVEEDPEGVDSCCPWRREATAPGGVLTPGGQGPS